MCHFSFWQSPCCILQLTDIRNWIWNIEQHASDNVNKILVGNKADMDESKRVCILITCLEGYLFNLTCHILRLLCSCLWFLSQPFSNIYIYIYLTFAFCGIQGFVNILFHWFINLLPCLQAVVFLALAVNWRVLFLILLFMEFKLYQ